MLKIVKYGHEALSSESTPVTSWDEELEKLVRDMEETMIAANGVGLAANQIGLTGTTSMTALTSASRISRRNPTRILSAADTPSVARPRSTLTLRSKARRFTDWIAPPTATLPTAQR